MGYSSKWSCLLIIIGIKGPCYPELRDVVWGCQNVGVKVHVESYK